ncbi:MAG: DUF2119 family protein [Candidatus Brockarchaeota archaeon]|nr:DUF2119 family protein [Candidatus Brockarchaeota archaeon]
MERHDLASAEPGPTRLMLGGIHGREWRTTAPILRALAKEGPPLSGKVVVVPRLSRAGSKYLSTLAGEYYGTEEGREMLSLISELRPRIYVELHCYKRSAYEALTDPGRMRVKGVPPFVDLGGGLLVGSVSKRVLPCLENRMGITLEVPCRLGKKGEVMEALRVLRDSTSVQEALREFAAACPMEIGRAVRLYKEWVGHAIGL